MPATSFCEYADTKPRKAPTLFALSEERLIAGGWSKPVGSGWAEGRRDGISVPRC